MPALRISKVAIAIAIALTGLSACDVDGAACIDTPGALCALAGTGIPGVGLDGVAPAQSKLYFPMAIAFDGSGAAYIVDRHAQRVRTITDGRIRTIIGSGEDGEVVDGPALQSPMSHPSHLAIDATGRLVIACWWNSLIARWDPSTGDIETIVGDGTRAYAGDGGPATDAHLDLPASVAFNPNGDLIIVDQASQRVRAVTDGGDGIITTIIGTGTSGFSGDGGPAPDAEIAQPLGQTPIAGGRVAFDNEGRLLFADNGNHRIRRVALDGTITTIVGSGSVGAGAPGQAALDTDLNRPTDIVWGPDDRLYIADTDNHCIRRLDDDGTLTTIAGVCGKGGHEGLGGPATAARLYRPHGVAFAPDGRLAIVDTFNHRIYAMVPAH